MDIEDGYLIDKNRPGLRKIFQQHTTAANTHLLPFSELIKFSSAVRIFPDLLSSFELKRIVVRLTNKHSSQDSELGITYLQFEKLIKHIAYQCFASLESDRLKLLLSHIRNACSLHYKVTLSTESREKDAVIDAPGPALSGGRGLDAYRKPQKADDSHRKSAPSLRLSNTLQQSLPSRAKEISNKVRQLYALISPRASSTEQRKTIATPVRPAMSPDFNTLTTKSFRSQVFDFEGEQPVRFSAQVESAGSVATGDRKDLAARMVKVFCEFRDKVQASVGKRRPAPSAKAIALVRTFRRHSFPRVNPTQRVVLSLAFRLWSALT